MGSMINSKQLQAIVDELVKELGRQPYSNELLAAIRGDWKPKTENQE